MEIVKDVVLVLHFVGLASLLGGFLVQISAQDKRVEPGMFHGALTQLVTGVALVGLNEAADADVNHVKVAVKLVLLLVVLGLVLVGRRTDRVPTRTWAAIGGLTLAEVVVAVVW